VVEHYWLHVVIIKWLSAASAWRPCTMRRKVVLKNVPFFHPGSGLAVRRAWRSGCWSHRQDRLRESGSQRGAGAAEGGEAALGFAECKMSRNGPGVWVVSIAALQGKLQKSVRLVSDWQITEVETWLCCFQQQHFCCCCIKHEDRLAGPFQILQKAWLKRRK